MTTVQKAIAVNFVVNEFFQNSPNVTNILAKELMNEFVKANIFNKNTKDGLPIRNLLRDLDRNNQLYLLPLLRVVRNSNNRNWYFTTPKYFEAT